MVLNEKYEKINEIYNSILENYESEARFELEKIKSEANLLKSSIINEGREKEDKLINDAKRLANLKKVAAKSAVKLEVKRKNLLNKYNLIENILDISVLEMKKFSECNPNYRVYLLNYIEQGIEKVYNRKSSQIDIKTEKIKKFYSEMLLDPCQIEYNPIEILIIINEKDRKFITNEYLERMMTKYDISLRIEFDNQIIGGVIVKTEDESIACDSTFIQRLKTKRPEIISWISNKIWPKF